MLSDNKIYYAENGKFINLKKKMEWIFPCYLEFNNDQNVWFNFWSTSDDLLIKRAILHTSENYGGFK